MSKANIGEYYNYILPEPLKEESPESRAKLAELYEEAKAMAERHHREAATIPVENK